MAVTASRLEAVLAAQAREPREPARAPLEQIVYQCARDILFDAVGIATNERWQQAMTDLLADARAAGGLDRGWLFGPRMVVLSQEDLDARA